MNVANLIETNSKRWSAAQVTPSLITELTQVATRLVAPSAKGLYQTVSKMTGVPWFVIAVIHEREASQNWHSNLAQGDPWNAVSVHVPRGRGPFTSWASAAIDALSNCPPYAAKWTDWSPGGMLTLLEEYNGLGYATRGIPSPYIWASTNQYTSGKYVSDGVFDPNAIDHQLGCAALLATMMKIDSTIKIGDSSWSESSQSSTGSVAAGSTPPVVKPPSSHVAPQQASPSLLSRFRTAIRKVFTTS